MRDTENGEGQATARRPDPTKNGPATVGNGQGWEGAGGTQPSPAWGFRLVLAAIVVIAIIYAVTMLTVGRAIQTPTTAIGAMTVTFTVVSTLVGTYFGVKAGLDGQDKAKEIMDKAARREVRPTRDRAPGQDG